MGGFQDAFRPLMEEFHYFHDFTNMILLFILVFVGFIIVTMTFRKVVHKGLLEGQLIECVLTLVPGLILIKIALPSLSLLYLIEESPRPDLTVKAIGVKRGLCGQGAAGAGQHGRGGGGG